MRLIINRKPGDDVIHDLDNIKEECNTDQIKEKEPITLDLAIEYTATGTARYCQHCMSDPQHESA